jgi:hypothetical protein
MAIGRNNPSAPASMVVTRPAGEIFRSASLPVSAT